MRTRAQERIGVLVLVALIAAWPLVFAFLLNRAQYSAEGAPAYVAFFIVLWLVWLVPIGLLIRSTHRELSNALEQKTATAEILHAISISPTTAQPVFETIVRNAVNLCGSQFANVFRVDGEFLHFAASHNVGPDYEELLRAKYPMRPDASQVSGRVLMTKSVVRLEDALADSDYDQRFPQALGWRRMMGVPMLRDGNPIGVIVVGWATPGPIPEVQEELLKTFADQAVIAIENARLFDEVQARTRDLSEALQQQTATADVLKAISRSTFDLHTVLDTLCEAAASLCDADHAWLFRKEGDFYRWAASYGHSKEDHERVKQFMLAQKIAPGRGTLVGRTALEQRPVLIPDALADPEYKWSEAVKVGKYRTTFGTPLLREGESIGVLALTRSDVRPFSERQIELATTFANQAVIAIENARLFDEVQARTRELSEALQQQTATADVLKVISRSPFHLQAVLDTLVEAAARLCNADMAGITRPDGGFHRHVTQWGGPPGSFDYMMKVRHSPGRGSLVGRVLLERGVVQIPDALADPEYELKEAQEIMGFRTLLGVPLLREGTPIGVLNLWRSEVRPFTPRQVELLSTFADQAVIAIENARLFDEVQARTRELSVALQQQTATADVLKVISRSPFQLQMVLDTLTESAARLCEADMAGFTRPDSDGVFRYATNYNFAPAWLEVVSSLRLERGRGSVVGRVLIAGAVVQIDDVLADPEHAYGEAAKLGGFRTFLGVPLLREGKPIGVLVLGRKAVKPFADKQIELLMTFADQAVIAIENARLFDEVQARTRELSEALEYQTATSEVLNVISRSPTQLQPVLDAIVQTAARLCSAEYSFITRYAANKCYLVAANRVDADHIQYLSRNPVSVDRGSVTGRVAIEKRALHVADVLADPEFNRLEWQKVGKQRTVLGVPLLREGNLIGVMILARTAVAPFTEKQIELVTTFADQAVIAIENARLFDEIQDKSRQLEIADKYKSHFLASASHDLRQPLHALNLFIAQLQSEPDPAERTRLVTRIDAAVASMNELFESLLDMSKLEAGILEPHFTEFPIQRVFKRIETTFADAAKQKELRLTVVPSTAWIRSDVILFERILMNLVSNAVRYTMQGGVVVGCRRHGQQLRVDVCDSGPGIPEEQQQSIFGEYYRLAAAEPDRGGGFGLGLAIVDRLGKLLNHGVELLSRPGQGSRFSLSVPLAAEHRVTAEAPAIPALPDPTRDKLVLVIDDDALVLEGMGGILRSWGCEVLTADSEEAAITALMVRTQQPDLIISDYRLANGRTGIEAIERLRDTLGGSIPAFLISGDTAPERLRDASENGFHLLHKPVAPMRLRAVLNQLLKTPVPVVSNPAAE